MGETTISLCYKTLHGFKILAIFHLSGDFKNSSGLSFKVVSKVTLYFPCNKGGGVG